MGGNPGTLITLGFVVKKNRPGHVSNVTRPVPGMALAAAAVRLAAAAAAGAASSCTASVDCPLAELLGLRVPPLCQRRGCPMSLPAAGGQGLHGAELCGGGARRIGFPSRRCGHRVCRRLVSYAARPEAHGARASRGRRRTSVQDDAVEHRHRHLHVDQALCRAACKRGPPDAAPREGVRRLTGRS